jgi:ketosteroid isomerase-like protein
VGISAEQIRAEVARFWGAFSSKSADVIESFYLPDSTVFSSVTHRAEPGRLAATRRKREYFHPQSRIRVQLGPIEVQEVGEHAAVASYSFEFHASRVSGVLGKAVDEDIENGRATQVFVQQADGRLCILHEHLSAILKA